MPKDKKHPHVRPTMPLVTRLWYRAFQSEIFSSPGLSKFVSDSLFESELNKVWNELSAAAKRNADGHMVFIKKNGSTVLADVGEGAGVVPETTLKAWRTGKNAPEKKYWKFLELMGGSSLTLLQPELYTCPISRYFSAIDSLTTYSIPRAIKYKDDCEKADLLRIQRRNWANKIREIIWSERVPRRSLLLRPSTLSQEADSCDIYASREVASAFVKAYNNLVGLDTNYPIANVVPSSQNASFLVLWELIELRQVDAPFSHLLTCVFDLFASALASWALEDAVKIEYDLDLAAGSPHGIETAISPVYKVNVLDHLIVKYLFLPTCVQPGQLAKLFVDLKLAKDQSIADKWDAALFGAKRLMWDHLAEYEIHESDIFQLFVDRDLAEKADFEKWDEDRKKTLNFDKPSPEFDLLGFRFYREEDSIKKV